MPSNHFDFEKIPIPYEEGTPPPTTSPTRSLHSLPSIFHGKLWPVLASILGPETPEINLDKLDNIYVLIFCSNGMAWRHCGCHKVII